jgi:hypothetical protein
MSMSEKELAKALRELVAQGMPPPPDPRQLAWEIFRRDQRRVRLVASLSVLFWLLGVAGLLFLIVALDRFIIFVRISGPPSASQPSAGPDAASATQKTTAPDQPRTPSWMDEMLWGTEWLHHGLWLVAASIVSMLLAALCTVVLIFSARHATLRQVSLALMQISEQARIRLAGKAEEGREPKS